MPVLQTLFQPCETNLHLLANTIFLHPPAESRQDPENTIPTTQDAMVRGLLEIYCPSARKIGGIRIKLKGLQTVAIVDSATNTTPISWEETVILEKELEIGLGDRGERDNNRGRSSRNASRANSRANSPTPANGRMGMSIDARPRASTSGPDSHEELARPSTDASNAGHDRSSPNTLAADQRRRGSGSGSGANTPSGSGGGGAGGSVISIAQAVGRAVARGRTTSRSNSRPSSRQVSRAVTPSRSRATSREPSPVRGRDANARTTLSSSGASSYHGTPEIQQTNPSTGATTSLRSASVVSNAPLFPPSPLELDRELSLSASQSLSLGHPDSEDFGLINVPHHLMSSSSNQDPSTLRTPPTGRGGAGSSRSASVGWGHSWDVFGTRQHNGNKGGRSGSKQRERSTDPEASGIELERGVHGFEWSFILDSSSAPYERSPYGRVRYVIKATVLGGGRARSDVSTWRDVFPIVNPNPDGGPTPLTVLYNDLHPTVGLLSIACTSNNISVAGVFNLDIHSPTPPVDLIVYLVRVSLETNIELRTRRKGKQKVPTKKHKLFEKGWVPPKATDSLGDGDGKKKEGCIRLDGGDGAWTVQGIARLPDDNAIRSSTVAGTRSDIRFSHQLVVEIVHSRAPIDGTQDRKLKVFCLRQPVLIPSCCVAYDAITLPAYTSEDSSERPADMPYDIGLRHIGEPGAPATAPPHASFNTSIPQQGSGHEYCVCGQSLQDLSAREREMIPTDRGYNPPINEIRLRGKIGELPLERVRSNSSTRSNGSNRSGRSISISRGDSIRRTLSRGSRASVERTGRDGNNGRGGEVEGLVTNGISGVRSMSVDRVALNERLAAANRNNPNGILSGRREESSLDRSQIPMTLHEGVSELPPAYEDPEQEDRRGRAPFRENV